MHGVQTLTVTVVQSDLFWENKKANLEMFEKKIMDISDKTEVIILPEMFSTGFSMNSSALAETMEDGTVCWMKKVSAAKRAVIAGSLIIKDEDKYFNRLIWMLPTGDYGYYDKRHLFSYADEHNHYQPGNKKLIASLKGWKINLQVCYDLRFPVWARQPAEPGKQYDLYINVANWPASRSNAWKTLLTARAIENQCFVIGVNRTGDDGNGHSYNGDSMIVDPLGKVIYQKEKAEEVYTCTLNKAKIRDARSRYPFLGDADEYVIMN